jgi:mRNA interferase MazF
MKRGEVWWIDFDPSIGGEIQKMRPAVIVSNNAANAHLNRIQVVPLTTSIERVFPGEALVRVGNQTRKALATQIMTAAKERLGRRLGVLRPEDLRAVESAILVQLGIVPRPARSPR